MISSISKTALLVCLLAILWLSSQAAFAAQLCDKPLPYRIGSIDSRFNLSQEELRKDIQEAGALWEVPYGSSLFTYDPQAKLSINLVFDQRQALRSQVTDLSDKLDNEHGTLNEQIAKYDSLKTLFEQRLNRYNQRVEYWNQRGGAPATEYQELVEEEKELNSLGGTINAMAEKLNRQAVQYNGKVDQLNNLNQQYESTLADKPEAGLYDPNLNRIDIYYVQNHDELVHTIAHELGHALGIGHVSDPAAIMHASTSTNLKITDQDFSSLQKSCQSTAWSRFIEKVQERKSMFQSTSS